MSPDFQSTPTAAAFAAQLRAERESAGMSPAELAKRTGVRLSRLERLESGEAAIDTAYLGAACAVFGITLGDFARRAEARLSE
jgi:transcriptional regulator with XRE-family HTH domain